MKYYQCSLCKQDIIGRRYHCIECKNYNLCEGCLNCWENHPKGGKGVWSVHHNEDGIPYYYNATEGLSTWDKPHSLLHYHRWFEAEPLSSPPSQDIAALTESDYNNTVWQTYSKLLDFYAERPLLGYREDKNTFSEAPDERHFTWKTYNDVKRLVEKFGSGLSSLKIEERSFIILATEICYQWIISEMACSRQNYALAPIETTLTTTILRHIFTSTKATTIICAHQLIDNYLEVLLAMSNESQCITIKHIISIISEPQFSKFSQFQTDGAEKLGISLHTFEDVVRFGTKTYYEPNSAALVDIYSLTYTSGSTGIPKGVVFSNYNFNRRICIQYSAPTPLITICYCSFAHITDRQTVIYTLSLGGKVGLFSNNMKYLYHDFQCIRPTVLSTTPHIFNELFSEYKAEVAHSLHEYLSPSSSNHIDNNSNNNYNKLKIDPLKSSSDFNAKTVEVKEAALRNAAAKLGGHIEHVGIGGAASSPVILQFIKDAFRVPVSYGYGATEVGPIYDFSVFSAYGGVEYKLIDVPDLEYYAKNNQGEILIKSPYLASGYYNDSENTTKSFDSEGYWHTGDIGEVSESPSGKKQLRIIDRIKNIFKLAQGKFVAPEKVEAVLLSSKFVHQSFVYGNSEKWFVVAIIIPQQKEILKYAEEKKLNFQNGDYDALCHHPQIQKLIYEDVQSVCKSLTPIEIPRSLYIHSAPFTKAEGLLTNSFKINRFAIEKKFKQQIEDLYRDDDDDDDKCSNNDIDYESKNEGGISLRSSLKNVNFPEDESTVNKLLWIICHHLGIRSKFITESSIISFDSLTISRFLSIIHERFNVAVPLMFIMQNPTIADLSHYINFGESGSSSSSLIQRMIDDLEIDFSSDLSPHYDHRIDLNNNINNNNDDNNDNVAHIPILDINNDNSEHNLSASSLQRNNDHFADEESWNIDYSRTEGNILLTGVTGFIGVFLLRRLLSSFPNAQIICLIRDDCVATAQRRLFNKLIEAKIIVSDNEKLRVSILLADLEKPRLHLSPKNFTFLCENITCIYHSAAHVNSVLSYLHLRNSNVLSSLLLLQIAHLHHSKPFFFLSTLGVLYDSQLPEDDDLEFSKILYLPGYSQTKFIFEKLLKKYAKSNQIPFMIFRPGMVSGDTQFGYLNPSDFFNRLLSAFIQLNAYLNLPSVFDITPVDFVSDFVVFTSCFPELYGKVFHLSNYVQSATLSQLGSYLIEFGYSNMLSLNSASEFSALLSTSSNSALESLKPYFTGGFECDYGQKSMVNTFHVLSTSSLRFPMIDKQLLFKYFESIASYLNRGSSEEVK